jgi:hypothetical protein
MALGAEIVAEREAKLGDTVMLRVPPKLAPVDFDTWSLTEERIAVQLNRRIKLDIELDPSDWMLPMDQISQRILRPYAIQFAEKIANNWPAGATLVSARQELPMGVREALNASSPEGLCLRFVLGYDVMRIGYMLCIDTLFGVTAVAYQPSAFDRELVAILMDARAELKRELEEFRMAA